MYVILAVLLASVRQLQSSLSFCPQKHVNSDTHLHRENVYPAPFHSYCFNKSTKQLVAALRKTFSLNPVVTSKKWPMGLFTWYKQSTIDRVVYYSYHVRLDLSSETTLAQDDIRNWTNGFPKDIWKLFPGIIAFWERKKWHAVMSMVFTFIYYYEGKSDWSWENRKKKRGEVKEGLQVY